jgi:hypothetical protein
MNEVFAWLKAHGSETKGAGGLAGTTAIKWYVVSLISSGVVDLSCYSIMVTGTGGIKRIVPFEGDRLIVQELYQIPRQQGWQGGRAVWIQYKARAAEGRDRKVAIAEVCSQE